MIVFCTHCGKPVTLNMKGAIGHVPAYADMRKHTVPNHPYYKRPLEYCPGSNTRDFVETVDELEGEVEMEPWSRADDKLRIAANHRKAAEVAEEEALLLLAEEARFGKDTDYPHLCTLIFDIEYPNWPNYAFTYVALKIVVPSSGQSRWYLTGKTSGAGSANGFMSFHRLVEDYLRKANTVAYATEWTEL